MKALIFRGDGVMQLEEVATPVPSTDELLVRVKSVGICGSDVEGYLGKTGRRLPPMIMGHELAGEVVKTFPDSRFAVGDHVAIQPKLFCGECSFCKTGEINICPNGGYLGVMSTNGGLAEYLAIPDRYLFKISPDMPWEHACMAEPLSVAYHGVQKVDLAKLKQSGPVLVIGAGPIGLLVLQVLKYHGIEDVIVSDLVDGRLEKAKALGASNVINPSRDQLPANIAYSFEAVGLGGSARQSLSALKCGGTAVWIGNAQKMIEVNMQQIVTQELSIVGSYVFNEVDFKNSLEMIDQGKIDLDAILTVEHGLEKGEEIFRSLGKGGNVDIIKMVLMI